MEPVYYIVDDINGDYATLNQIHSTQSVTIALALLPEGICIGTKLKSFMMEYEIVK